MVLVLDDITELGEKRFAEYFDDQGKSRLHSVMRELRLSLQNLHGIPGSFVFCTGRSLWLSSQALVGSGSPLIVQPTLLQPLTAADVEQALRLTSEAPGRSLLDSMGVAAPLVGAFAARAVELTGGIGRALQFVLRARQRAVLGGAPVLNSRKEVAEALDALLPRIAKIPGVLLRVTWDGPAEAVAAKESPSGRSRRRSSCGFCRSLRGCCCLTCRSTRTSPSSWAASGCAWQTRLWSSACPTALLLPHRTQLTRQMRRKAARTSASLRATGSAARC